MTLYIHTKSRAQEHWEYASATKEKNADLQGRWFGMICYYGLFLL